MMMRNMMKQAQKARPSRTSSGVRRSSINVLKRSSVIAPCYASIDRLTLERMSQDSQRASASEWLNLVQSEVSTLERQLETALARNNELEQALNKQASTHQRELQEAKEAAEKIRAQMRDSSVVSAADWKGYVQAEEAQVNVLEKELVLVTARNTELDIARDMKVKSLKQELMEAKMEAQLIQKQIREEKVASAADWLTFVQTSSEADQKQINALEEQLALAQTSSNELQAALEQQAASLKMQLLEAKEASDEFKKQMRQEKIATSADWLTYVQSAAEADQKQIDTLEKELQLALACNSDLELASNEKAMALQAAFEEAKMEAADLRKQMRQDKISSAAEWLTYVQDTSAADQKQINALEEQLSLAVSSNQEMDQAMKEQAAALQMEVKQAKMEAEQVKLQMRQDKIASAADWLSYVQDTSAADQKQINALEEQLSQTVTRHEQLEQAVAVQTATLQQELKAAKLDAQRIKSEMREALIVSGAEWLTYVQAEQKQILLLEEQMQMAEARHVDMQQALDDQTAAHQLALQEAKAVADAVKAQARAEKISTAAEWLTYVQSEQAQILTLEEELQAAAAQTRQMEETLALQSEAHAQDLKQAALAQQALKKQMRDEKVAAAADWLTYAQEASEADMAKIAALEAELAVALAQVEELEKATSEERSALQQEVKNAKADAERIKLEMRQAKISSAADWLTYVQEVSEADAQKISALEAELEAANARVVEVEALAAQETVELESRLKEALATAERIKLEMRAAKVASAAEWLDFVQQSSETDQARIAELEAELQQARQELMEVKTDSDSIRESTLSSAAELLTSVQAVQNRVGSLESELQMALARNAELEQQYDAASSQVTSFYSYNSYTPAEASMSDEESQSEDEQEHQVVYDYANTTDFFGSAEPVAEEEVPVNNQFDAFLDAPSFW